MDFKTAFRRTGVFSISLKIKNVPLAGVVSIGALSLGALYVVRKYPAPENAIRGALEKIDNSGVVDPKVTNIADGSILVELHCFTETSFLVFLEDFEAKTIKFRLEEEFKKIGLECELDVTISNLKEVNEKAKQIRERSTAPREGDETEQSKVDSSAVQQSVSLTDPSVTEESLTGKLEEDTALASSSKSAPSSQGERAHESSRWTGNLYHAATGYARVLGSREQAGDQYREGASEMMGGGHLRRDTVDPSKLLSSLLEHESYDVQKIYDRLDKEMLRHGHYHINRAVALYYGLDHYQIYPRLETYGKGLSRALIERLAAAKPELTVREFVTFVRKEAKLNDVANLLEKYDADW